MDPNSPFPGSSELLPGLRQCQRCGIPLPQAQAQCRSCQYVELDLVPDLPQEEEVSPATWPCVCGFPGNLISATSCQSCGKSAFERPESGLVSRIRGWFEKNPEVWVCNWCKYEHNLDSLCEKCSKPQGSTPIEGVWSCLNCNSQNSNNSQFCLTCGCGPDWSHYLEFHKIRLNSTRLNWYCPKCSWGTDLNSYKCSHCKAVPSAVSAFLSKVKAKESSFSLSWLSLS